MSDGLRLYHNPRCSKSRAALALLQARGLEPEIVEYLKTPPDAATIEVLIDALGVAPRAAMRPKEAPYAELGLDAPDVDRARLVAAIAAHPILLERPIAVRGRRAVIGRPPERVLELLDEA
jgi:arsenate reductase